MQFSEWFKERLTASGMSAKEFGDRCRLSKQMIYYYLSGQRMPTEATMQRMAEALGVELTAEQTAAFTRKLGRPGKSQ